MITIATRTTLLAVLKAIVAECMDYPLVPCYSSDSYLPAHLLDAAQQAIEQADGTTKVKKNGGIA